MKLSLNWVREFTDVDVSIDELIELAVTRLGGVEGYSELAERYQEVLVAKVVSCEPHPNADKLTLCSIDDGYINEDVERLDDDMIQVVCGAPNVEPGQLVAWIPPKATVPATADTAEPFVLDSREIRGEISHGMIASPKELGLSDEHEGILVIDEEGAKPGQSFSDLYELDDVVIDIENKMFTHRPDGFGQLGVAREIAGIQHQSFESPKWYREDIELPSGGESEEIKKLSVNIKEKDLCPRLTAVALENVKVEPSPPWLQSRLMRVGITPRNNVVDITNYIMALTAQPIHAFDFDKIAKNGKAEITVRKPKKGETLKLINGDTIEPHKEAILICGHDGPIGLGGVMGGADSEISDDTTRVVIECANFNMYNIRRTSMVHGLFTDAVTRFSKGQSPRQLQAVLAKTVELLSELAGASVVGEAVDSNYVADATNPTIKISNEFVNRRLGTELSTKQMQQLLANVEMIVKRKGDELEVTAPFWRTDIEIKEDIVEEVGRLHGFDQLPRQLPQRPMKPSTISQLAKVKRAVRAALSQAGANELSTHSFVNQQLMQRAGQDAGQAFEISNALSRELQHYRLTPLPSLLDKVHPNIKAGYDEFTLFELAAAHDSAEHKDDDDGLPKELEYLDLVYASKTDREGAPFYRLRATLDQALSDIIAAELVYKPIKKKQYHPVIAPFDENRSAIVETRSGEFIGIIGELKPSVVDAFKLPAYAAAASVELQALADIVAEAGTSYQPLPKFPSVTQDITLKTAADNSYQQLFDELKSALSEQLDDTQMAKFEPLAIFAADDSDQHQLSWRVTVVDESGTLKADQVNQLLNDAADSLSNVERV